MSVNQTLKPRTPISWPNKFDVFGVFISATTYEEAVPCILQAANEKRFGAVSALAVHGLMVGAQDKEFKSHLNDFDIVAPDGQPVRTALNLLYDTRLRQRVYGPELMLRLCMQSMEQGVGVYLYGSTKPVIDALYRNLMKRFPKLRIVGHEPSFFRPLTYEEDIALVERINKSGAGILFVGLGCPLQEKFAHAHKDKIQAVQVCIGAAFDFHGGNKRMAPSWMQRNGLEWLFRLTQEPRRLWRRYLTTNSNFLFMLFLQWSGIKKF